MSSQEATNYDDILDQELENILNHPSPPYGEKSYWNTRYDRDTEPFEWYQPWSRLKPPVDHLIHPGGVALNLGCGNSTMSQELINDGFNRVISVDFSDVVIEQMKQKYSSEARLEWEVGDIMKLKYSNNTFDYVFDKATLDTIICSDNSNKSVNTLLKEVARVLKPGGIFVLVSYGTPPTRKRFFEGTSLGLNIQDTISVEKTGVSGSFHYVYVIKKSE